MRNGHYMAATSAPTAALDIEDPDALLRWFWPVPEAGFAFCSRCGSSLFWQSSADSARWSVCAGTLQTPTGLRTTRAIWTSQAGDYYRRPDLPELPTE